MGLAASNATVRRDGLRSPPLVLPAKPNPVVMNQPLASQSRFDRHRIHNEHAARMIPPIRMDWVYIVSSKYSKANPQTQSAQKGRADSDRLGRDGEIGPRCPPQKHRRHGALRTRPPDADSIAPRATTSEPETTASMCPRPRLHVRLRPLTCRPRDRKIASRGATSRAHPPPPSPALQSRSPSPLLPQPSRLHPPNREHTECLVLGPQTPAPCLGAPLGAPFRRVERPRLPVPLNQVARVVRQDRRAAPEAANRPAHLSPRSERAPLPPRAPVHRDAPQHAAAGACAIPMSLSPGANRLPRRDGLFQMPSKGRRSRGIRPGPPAAQAQHRLRNRFCQDESPSTTRSRCPDSRTPMPQPNRTIQRHVDTQEGGHALRLCPPCPSRFSPLRRGRRESTAAVLSTTARLSAAPERGQSRQAPRNKPMRRRRAPRIARPMLPLRAPAASALHPLVCASIRKAMDSMT
jgi:hypothetical protein